MHAGDIVTPITQMGKLSHRVVKKLAQGGMVSGRTKTPTTTLSPLRHSEVSLVVWVSDLRGDLKNLALSLR